MMNRTCVLGTVVALAVVVGAAGQTPAPSQPATPNKPTTPSGPTSPSAPAKPDSAKPDAAKPAGMALPKLAPSVQLKRNDVVAADKVKVDDKALEDAVKRGVAVLLELQEGDAKSEWPYEGVYRAQGEVPVGYRIGGTSITAIALMRAPGFAGDGPRKAAVERAATFVCKAVQHPLMSIDDYDAGYDVRGWGYTYGLMFLLEAKEAKALPEKLAADVEKTIRFCLDGVQRTVIPEAGGWNYARPTGKDKPAGPSPFMTGPTLIALFEAKKAGYAVDEKIVSDALKFMAAARGPGPDRTVVYSGLANERSVKGSGAPGASGRMCVTEVTLTLAGQGNVDNLRNAVETFIKNWDQLDVRRMMTGTHIPPYSVAPYYFMYAHYFAAQAVEMLPEAERAGYREKINKLLFSVRREDGSWNDRIFKRSGGYGTSMAILAILQPKLPAPVKWEAPKKAAEVEEGVVSR
ncbi:MAG: hypothetical protein ACREJO_03810 [Phycisphaerales bacterium]